jgi:hypothetical protein
MTSFKPEDLILVHGEGGVVWEIVRLHERCAEVHRRITLKAPPLFIEGAVMRLHLSKPDDRAPQQWRPLAQLEHLPVIDRLAEVTNDD